jgi:hypothetical protein
MVLRGFFQNVLGIDVAQKLSELGEIGKLPKIQNATLDYIILTVWAIDCTRKRFANFVVSPPSIHVSLT